MKEPSVARRVESTRIVSLNPVAPLPSIAPSWCEFRTVDRDGRIVCKKIVEGDNEVAPHICHTCPLKLVNCAHLRFSLKLTSPYRLVVRFNGREEVWDDEPPRLCFERAACAAKVKPIDHPRACASCSLRQPLQVAKREPGKRLASGGKVVPFRPGEAVAATG
jgi:hypothetical protein